MKAADPVPEDDLSLRARIELASPWCARQLVSVDAPAFAALRAADTLDALRARVTSACADAQDEAAQMAALRRVRHRELTRIAVRELAGDAALDDTLAALSTLAEACCEQALRWATHSLHARHGTPRDAEGREAQPVVLGMGKLGGGELNFSSDIDLILCYTAGGETDGARALSNEEYFARLAHAFTRLLATPTEDGFVYRVDWMLRPFGSAGPPASSFGAMEHYYQTHGREWERYALIKARPVAGDRAAGAQLLRTLRPFVYRRYLDYNAIGALRDLKRMIEEEVRRRDLHDNIKLGAGGIREVEFIVQSFQLVRGGVDPALRDARLRPVLRHLGAQGYLDAEAAARLDACYVFLRRVENAIQMYEDAQTHALPEAPAARAALLAALRMDESAFQQQLAQTRAAVRQEFERVFSTPARGEQNDGLRARVLALWSGTLVGDDALNALAETGCAYQPAAVLAEIHALRDTRLVRAMPEAAQARLLDLLAALLGDARTQPSPERALVRVLRIVQAVSGRATYLTLLRESATARAQLLRLCDASPWVSELIAQSPVLLDGLLDPRTLYDPPERAAMEVELARRCDALPPEDTEAAMDVLRRYQKEITLRIAAADVSGALPLVKVSDRLTWLAETLVRQALVRVQADMRTQHGLPLRRDGAEAGFAVIAYGKFGGIELGYGSDLDVVFLHDCDRLDEDTRGGARPLNAGLWFGRCGQRLIHWLSTQTGAGRAYELDIELRPSGRSGLMVTSLQGFIQYQQAQAWTWEHQALTRARAVAGPGDLCAAFEVARRNVLCRPREPQTLAAEIIAMRQKMRASLDKSSAELWDLKQGEGGMIDVEFITQYLVLRDAHRDVEIVRWSDNWRQLDALEAAGSVSAAQKSELIDLYRGYRAFAHARSLQQEETRAPQSAFGPERAAVRALWQAFIGL